MDDVIRKQALKLGYEIIGERRERVIKEQPEELINYDNLAFHAVMCVGGQLFVEHSQVKIEDACEQLAESIDDTRVWDMGSF